ncbi:MAG: elongation factor P [Planctomycetes bacterium]|nr:elongation factor P [Planctomycetota bacterium]
MPVPATNIRKGQVILHEGALWIVVEAEARHQQMRRGALQTKLKNLRTGDTMIVRFRSSDKVEFAFLDKVTCEYLYQQGDHYVFMDVQNYEQYHLSADLVGDLMHYVKPNTQIQVTFYEGHPLTVELPSAVVLEITETEPGFRGNTATNVYKSATVETGLEVKVPLHINKGDRIKINTESGEFVERVNA